MSRVAIFGSSYGIGKALSISIVRKGYKVALFSSNESGVQETAKRIEAEGGDATINVVDLSTEEGVTDAVNKLKAVGNLNGLVYLASPTPDPDLELNIIKTENALISAYFFMNGIAPSRLLKEALPLFNKESGGFCVAISSDWATNNSNGPAVFSAAKSSLAKVFDRVRPEFLLKGVRTTIIYPGDIASFDADWEEPKWDIDSDLKDVIEELGNERIPLQELTKVMDMIIECPNTLVREIHLSPTSPEYTF